MTHTEATASPSEQIDDGFKEWLADYEELSAAEQRAVTAQEFAALIAGLLDHCGPLPFGLWLRAEQLAEHLGAVLPRASLISR